MIAASFITDPDFTASSTSSAFALFIYGLMGLTGPDAPRCAATASPPSAWRSRSIATLLIPGIGNWGLIVLGVAIGTAIGVPAARQVQDDRDAADGRAVQRRRRRRGRADRVGRVPRVRRLRATSRPTSRSSACFAAIVGSVSFWGSNIAFAKLQELLPGRPITIGPAHAAVRQPRAARWSRWRARVAIVAGSRRRDPDDRAAARRGGARQLRRAADRRRRHAGRHLAAQRVHRPVSAAATGVALNNTALIVAGMIVGASGSILTNLMAAGHEPLDPVDRRRRLRRRRRPPGGAADDGVERTVRSTSAVRRRDPDGLRPPGRRSSRATAWPSPRPSTPCAR